MGPRLSIILFLAVAIFNVNAQTGPALVGSSYGAPPAIPLVPGQVTTFWVAGLNQIPGAAAQATPPLPPRLAGISLQISQLTYGKGFPLPTLQVPILSIAQSNGCTSPLTGQPASTAAFCLMTAITVQIPWELVVDPFTQPPYTTLTVTQDGVAGPAINVRTAHDQVHILTCSNQPCITHADGSLITSDTLPVAGEILTMYLIGLGAPNLLPTTGQVSPTPALVENQFFIDLVFGANVGPGTAVMNPPAGQSPKVLFSGLTPGQIGLYQINFQLPATFPSIPPCGINGNLTVTSNLAINIGTPYYSHDGVAICVQP